MNVFEGTQIALLCVTAIVSFDGIHEFARWDAYSEITLFEMIWRMTEGAIASQYTPVLWTLLSIPFATAILLRWLYVRYEFSTRWVMIATRFAAFAFWWTFVVGAVSEGQLLSNHTEMMRAVAVDLLLLCAVAVGYVDSGRALLWTVACGPVGMFGLDAQHISLLASCLAACAVIVAQMPSLYIGFQENSTFALGNMYTHASTRGVQLYVLTAGVSLFATRGVVRYDVPWYTFAVIQFWTLLVINYNVALGLLWTIVLQSHFLRIRSAPDASADDEEAQPPAPSVKSGGVSVSSIEAALRRR